MTFSRIKNGKIYGTSNINIRRFGKKKKTKWSNQFDLIYREVDEIVSLMSEAAAEIAYFVKQFHLIN